MSTTESPRLIYDIERGVSIRPRDAMPENAFNRVDLIDSVDSASPQLNYADVRTRVGLTSMEDVTPAIVEWLWDGHIPLGNITSIDGDPGQGKSLLLLWLAAQVTRGVKGFRQGRVLMLLAEDNADDTVKPRLMAAGADCSQIMFFNQHQSLTSVGLHELRTVIEKEQPVLVIIDPLFAFIDGQVNTRVDNQSRTLLTPLKQLAADCHIAVVWLRHMTKDSEGKTGKAIYRGVGSIAFTAAARAVYIAADDPNTEGQHVLACAKLNVGPKPKTLGYVIDTVPLVIAGALQQIPYVRWTGESSLNANAVIGATKPDEPRAVEEAVEWLREHLQNGPRPYKEIVQCAQDEAGISERTLRRAKAQLKIHSHKTGLRDGWVWELAEDGS